MKDREGKTTLQRVSVALLVLAGFVVGIAVSGWATLGPYEDCWAEFDAAVKELNNEKGRLGYEWTYLYRAVPVSLWALQQAEKVTAAATKAHSGAYTAWSNAYNYYMYLKGRSCKTFKGRCIGKGIAVAAAWVKMKALELARNSTFAAFSAALSSENTLRESYENKKARMAEVEARKREISEALDTLNDEGRSTCASLRLLNE